MSNLSAVINGVLGRQNKNYADLVRESGISKSTISKIVAGAPASPEVFGKLVRHISPKVSDQSSTAKAHLLDELERAGIPAGLVHILGKGEENADSIRGLVRSEVYDWIYLIAKAIASGNDEFEGILKELALFADRIHQVPVDDTATPQLTIAVDNPEGGIDTNVPGSSMPKDHVEQREKPQKA